MKQALTKLAVFKAARSDDNSLEGRTRKNASDKATTLEALIVSKSTPADELYTREIALTKRSIHGLPIELRVHKGTPHEFALGHIAAVEFA